MKRHNLDSYKDGYETISLERTDSGILRATLHGLNDPEMPCSYDAQYNWSFPHLEWSYCFYDIARDYRNEVVILTHAGDHFLIDEPDHLGHLEPISPEIWDRTQSEGIWLQMNLLSIECPVIGVVRGANHIHAELFTQSDIVLCSEDATFKDGHIDGPFAPGDSVQVHWPTVLGPTRGKYFLLRGQIIDAKQALDLGVVNEILPADDLIPRAYELAEEMLKRPKLVRRYTRMMGTLPARKQMLDQLGYGMALEGLTAAASRAKPR